MIVIKSRAELAKMREAGRIVALILGELAEMAGPGYHDRMLEVG